MNVQVMCSICLSTNRALEPLKWLDKKLLLFYNIHLIITNPVMCWECSRFFRKTDMFLQKAAKAQQLLKMKLIKPSLQLGGAPCLSSLVIAKLRPIELVPPIERKMSPGENASRKSITNPKIFIINNQKCVELGEGHKQSFQVPLATNKPESSYDSESKAVETQHEQSDTVPLMANKLKRYVVTSDSENIDTAETIHKHGYEVPLTTNKWNSSALTYDSDSTDTAGATDEEECYPVKLEDQLDIDIKEEFNNDADDFNDFEQMLDNINNDPSGSQSMEQEVIVKNEQPSNSTTAKTQALCTPSRDDTVHSAPPKIVPTTRVRVVQSKPVRLAQTNLVRVPPTIHPVRIVRTKPLRIEPKPNASCEAYRAVKTPSSGTKTKLIVNCVQSRNSFSAGTQPRVLVPMTGLERAAAPTKTVKVAEKPNQSLNLYQPLRGTIWGKNDSVAKEGNANCDQSSQQSAARVHPGHVMRATKPGRSAASSNAVISDPKTDPLCGVYKALRRNGRLLESHTNLIMKTISISEDDTKRLREEVRLGAPFRKALFKCDLCVETFLTQKDCDEHADKHSTDKSGSVVCDVCTQCFRTDAELNEHKKSHLKCLQCVACSAQALQAQSMWWHFDNYHILVAFTCRFCYRMFWSGSKRCRHMFHEHGVKHSCTVCGMEFPELNILNKHIEKICNPNANEVSIEKPPERKTEKCQKCNQEYKYKQLHLANCPEKEIDIEKTYCKPCEKFFKNAYSLKAHVRVQHAEENRCLHPCPHCKKKFTTSNFLKKHIEFFHKRKREQKKYICDFCQREFNLRTCIVGHMKKHMPELNKVTNVCDICGKVLRVGKGGMIEHRNGHLGIRPYSCQYCGDTFTYSGARYTHIKLKHKKQNKNTIEASATKETDNKEGNKSEKDDATESVSSTLKHKITKRNTSLTKKTDNKKGKRTKKADDSEIDSVPKAKRKGNIRNKTRTRRKINKGSLEDASNIVLPEELLDYNELMTMLS